MSTEANAAEPFGVPIGGGVVTLTFAELQARLPDGAGLVGAIATASTTATAWHQGPRSFPALVHLYAHRRRRLVLRPGDVIRLESYKRGTVSLQLLMQTKGEPTARQPQGWKCGTASEHSACRSTE